jgi:hypothetical protein
MKTHQDILNAQQQLIVRQNECLDLNYEFFMNLTDQIYVKAKVPREVIKIYKHGYSTEQYTNIIEEWVRLTDDGSCHMQISFVFEPITHDVEFTTIRKHNNFTLKINSKSRDNYREFDFLIGDPIDIQCIQFDEVIDFLIDSIVYYYNLRYK